MLKQCMLVMGAAALFVGSPVQAAEEATEEKKPSPILKTYKTSFAQCRKDVKKVKGSGLSYRKGVCTIYRGKYTPKPSEEDQQEAEKLTASTPTPGGPGATGGPSQDPLAVK